MRKVMFDTNAFDFIYNNDLIDEIIEVVNRQVLLIVITHVQADEIEKIEDNAKRDALKKIPTKYVYAACGFLGSAQESKHGYVGAKLDNFGLVDEKVSELLGSLQKKNRSNPMGNSADLTILYTAANEQLEYLVTDDVKDFEISLKVLKDNNIGTNLQLIDNTTFVKLLNKWQK